MRKGARDMITCALVDRAVEEAATRACHAERLSDAEGGLCALQLMEALHSQISAVMDQLRPDNIGEYVTLPDGVRVASVRRLETSFPIPALLERAI